MNKKIVISSIATLSAFFLTAAHANVPFFSGSSGEDLCKDMPGHWSGVGTMTTGSLTCYYTGTAEVTLESASTYSATMDLTKDPKSPRTCLPQYHETLDGITCNQDVINIQATGVNLSGTLYTNNGVLSTELKGSIGPSSVDMTIHK